MRTSIAGRLAALAIAAAPAGASARVIVDTGTPANWSNTWSLFGEAIPQQGQYLAARFDLDHAATLNNLEAYVVSYGGAFTVSVASDSGGDRSTSGPLNTLFSRQAQAPATQSGAWSGVHGVDWSLDAGSYWVIFSVEPDRADSLEAGYLPDNAPRPTQAEAFFDVPGDGWGREDDLDFGVRIDSVPEPAAWAMMIGGFALAGAGLRRNASARTQLWTSRGL